MKASGRGLRKSLFGKVDWKGTYQSSCDLAETRTEQFCEEIIVPKEIVATLLLAAGGKGGVSVRGGGGGSKTNSPTGTERRKIAGEDGSPCINVVSQFDSILSITRKSR